MWLFGSPPGLNLWSLFLLQPLMSLSLFSPLVFVLRLVFFICYLSVHIVYCSAKDFDNWLWPDTFIGKVVFKCALAFVFFIFIFSCTLSGLFCISIGAWNRQNVLMTWAPLVFVAPMCNLWSLWNIWDVYQAPYVSLTFCNSVKSWLVLLFAGPTQNAGFQPE